MQNNSNGTVTDWKNENLNAEGKLTYRAKLGYGACDLGGNLFFTVVAFWLMNYLTDEVGLSAAYAGFALMVGKVIDAVTDPTVGFLSDRTRTRWGRRRPWLLFSAVPLGVAFAYMFVNPELDEQLTLFIWAAVTYSILCAVYTGVNIPYNSMHPELTKDFNERTTLSGYRQMFAVMGTLTGAGAAMPIIGLVDDKTSGYMLMGILFGAIMTLTALVPFFTLKEPPHPPVEKTHNIFKSYLDAFKNRPFLLILLPWAFNITGITVVTATLIYYFKYVFQNEDLITSAILVMLLTSMVFIPISVKLANKIGKRPVYILGMSIFSLAVIVFFFLGHKMDIYFAYGVMFFSGMGFSSHYVMPWAIVPDTVEYDYAKTGVRREGIYYGLWTFTIKMGQALAGAFVGIILELFDYIPDVAQSETAILGIRLLIGPFTAVFFIIGNIILYFYPITKEKYAEIQETIKTMEEAKKA